MNVSYIVRRSWLSEGHLFRYVVFVLWVLIIFDMDMCIIVNISVSVISFWRLIRVLYFKNMHIEDVHVDEFSKIVLEALIWNQEVDPGWHLLGLYG
jgi:hypothetical protein